MSAWVVVVLAGAGSYLLRISMLLVAARAEVPAVLERAARFAVPVAFAALAATSVAGLATAGGADAIPALAAVAVGVVAVRWTGNARAAMLAGMPTLWLLLAVTG
jgi:branched-subunit amino acid transport protein